MYQPMHKEHPYLLVLFVSTVEMGSLANEDKTPVRDGTASVSCRYGRPDE
ncbi:hypothetical protein LguiB_034075 [Lonicera macranthoides]